MGSNTPIRIGDTADYSAWTGDIDEVAIYGSALSESQVLNHLEAAYPGDFSSYSGGLPLEDEPSADPFGETSDLSEAPPPEAFAGSGPALAEATSTIVDKGAIVDYARRYVGTFHDTKGRLDDPSGWNPDYRSWDNDCTNFVSQALHAGGWPTTAFDRQRGWYYLPDQVSLSWINAKWMVRWMNVFHPNERTTLLRYIWNVQPGDVIAVDWNGRGRDGQDPVIPSHTMVVTSRYVMADGRTFVGITYHTSNRLDKSLRQLIKNHQKPPAVWWAFRVKATF